MKTQTYNEFMKQARPGEQLYLKKEQLNICTGQYERVPLVRLPGAPFCRPRKTSTIPELLTALRAGKLKLYRAPVGKGNLLTAYTLYMLEK